MIRIINKIFFIGILKKKYKYKLLKTKIPTNSRLVRISKPAVIAKIKIVEIPSTWIEVKNRKSNFKVLKWIPYYIYWLFYSTVRSYTFKIKNFFK